MHKINELLKELVQRGGSDLHITSTKQPRLRLKKQIVPCQSNIIVTNDDVINWVQYVSKTNNNFIKEESIKDMFNGIKPLDFSYALGNFRFRSHVYVTLGGLIAVAFRKINSSIPTISQLRLPNHYTQISNYPQGLVLITGPTGSGKSTTIASLIELINQRHYKHILTLEDPIEYVFEEKNCMIHQRELYKDFPSFKEGIKSAFREDPDVILIGEIRDAEEMQNALTLSASGHLVFATLHTSGILHTIGRILSMFSPEDERSVRNLLQDNLKCIINQTLYTTQTGRVIPLLEHLFIDKNTHRILAGDMKDHQVKSILDSTSNSERDKVMFLWQSILEYTNAKVLTRSEGEDLIKLFDVDKLKQFQMQVK